MEKLNVKVGDKVIVRCGAEPDRIAEVTKITPTGRIKIDGRNDIQFTPYGEEMGNRDMFGWRCYLYEATAGEMVRIKHEDVVRRAVYKMQNFKASLSYGDAVEILKILEK